MDLHVNETVKEYLQTISKKYEFEYMFRGEKFGLVNTLNMPGKCDCGHMAGALQMLILKTDWLSCQTIKWIMSII